MRTLSSLLALLLALASTPASAEPPAPLTDRARILSIEMNRGPAEALAPFLEDGAHELSRWYAIRALGRIGDRGEAPAMLAKLLEAKAEPLAGVLWAAGIAQAESLYEPIKAHLTHKDAAVSAAAAEALGWTGKTEAASDLTPLLNHPDAAVRRGALMGLGRLRPEGVLERVVGFLNDADPSVQEAAGFAAWLIAGSRKRAAKGVDPKWDGDMHVAHAVLPLLRESASASGRKMDALRVLGSVLPESLDGHAELAAALAPLASDADARVVQDLVWRILTPRKGTVSDGMLTTLLTHGDPKVRQQAVEALGQHDSDAARTALLESYGAEQDARVLAAYAVELHRTAASSDAQFLEGAAEKGMAVAAVDAVLGSLNLIAIAAAADSSEALAELRNIFTTEALSNQSRHALAYMTLMGEIEGHEDAWIEPWLAGFLPKGGPLDVIDPHVTSSAIGLVATNKYWDLFAQLQKSCGTDMRDLLHGEVRLALADVFGKLAADEKCTAENKRWCLSWLKRAAFGDMSAWTRAKAREALKTLEVSGVPEEDPLSPTDWKGLPRPTSPVLGIDLSKGSSAWLSEAEILRLADAIHHSVPRLRFETTQGAFEVTLDPDEAPVHSVSCLLAVHAGLYDGTRWHRVVPNFVIQGGDPHGHGAGNGGWFVPDEITRRSYRRGALGMPKSRKDDGGCQLFFMHTHYIPLDGRYTAYGEVVSGMEAVDKIRVGDKITKATIVAK